MAHGRNCSWSVSFTLLTFFCILCVSFGIIHKWRYANLDFCWPQPCHTNMAVFLTHLSIFALWPVVFWKYVLKLFGYIAFFKNLFLYFKKSYFNLNKPLYSYLRIRLNTLMYVDNTFMQKYAQIWFVLSVPKEFPLSLISMTSFMNAPSR